MIRRPVGQIEKLPLQRFLEGLLRSPLPRLNLAEYRALVGPLPPPNPDQIEAFAAYVSAAKSWYKGVTSPNGKNCTTFRFISY